jgi:thymidylate synthase (FAD)
MNELEEVIEEESKLKKEYLGKKIDCLDKGFVRLVDFFGTDSSIVQAARVSYGKGTTKKSRDRDLIRYLMRHKHTSPLEMVEFKFHCKMPIFIARQWVRHRTASLNEMSGRYSEMPEECYVPRKDRLQRQAKDNKQGSEGQLDEMAQNTILTHLEKDQTELFDRYHSYLDIGLARELSRINLPLSTYTQWYWKMDLHNLFHFLRLRMDHHAQAEIQEYGNAIYDLIKPIVPISCEAFEDYVLGAETFSSTEMSVIKELINVKKEELSSLKIDGMGKLEIKEFLDKLFK